MASKLDAILAAVQAISARQDAVEATLTGAKAAAPVPPTAKTAEPTAPTKAAVKAVPAKPTVKASNSPVFETGFVNFGSQNGVVTVEDGVIVVRYAIPPNFVGKVTESGSTATVGVAGGNRYGQTVELHGLKFKVQGNVGVELEG